MADQTAQKSVVKVDDPKEVELNNWKEFVEKWRKLSIKAIPYGLFLGCLAPFFHLFIIQALLVIGFIVPIVSWYCSHSFKEVKTWERLLVFKMGKLEEDVRQPGWQWVWWPWKRTVFVKTYERRIDVPPQKVILSRLKKEEAGEEAGKELDTQKRGTQKKDEKITVMVDSMLWFKVAGDKGIDKAAKDSVTEIQDVYGATKDFFIVTLRNVCSQADLDTLIGEEKTDLNQAIITAVEAHTKEWGIKITKAGIQDVILPKAFEDAMNEVPAANRKRETTIINADAEARRVEAVYRKVYKEDPELTLRAMEAIERFAEGKGSPILIGGVKEAIKEIFGKGKGKKKEDKKEEKK